MQMKIYQKTYDMVKFAHPVLRNYPKAERHVLVASIKKSIYRILEGITRAQKSKQKLRFLYGIDTELEVLTTKVRLSAELQFLPIKKYKYWAEKLTELGKMIGGWIKNVTN